MARLERIEGKLKTIIPGFPAFSPTVIIDDIMYQPESDETEKCDCKKQSINLLKNQRTWKAKHCCDRMECIQKALQVLKLRR